MKPTISVIVRILRSSRSDAKYCRSRIRWPLRVREVRVLSGRLRYGQRQAGCRTESVGRLRSFEDIGWIPGALDYVPGRAEGNLATS